MQKLILIITAILGALSVGIGAFGAHGLSSLLESHGRLDTFETAVKYQFYHTLALLAIGLLMYKIQSQFLGFAAWSMIAGIFIFSGSLYILSISNVGKWGAVTPFGGLFLIAGWVFLLIAIFKGFN